jgi:2'-hydroxyisoflavone reductase
MPTRRELLIASLAAAALAPAAVRAAAPPRPLRLLILGGTGFTGPHQVRYALERGHHVTLFNRGRRPRDWPGEVVELTGDRDRGELSALAEGRWDVCIDNPTTLPSWVRDAGRLLQDRVGHYLFISTISVYADNATPGAAEDAPLATYSGADPMAETGERLRADMSLYGPLKARSEAEARHWFGGRCTIIRPGLIVGPGDETDRFTYWPARLDRGGDVVAPGDGSDPVQFIDARDLAEWTIRLAERQLPGTFNATGPAAALTMAQMLATIDGVTEARSRLHWLPAEFLREHGVGPWVQMPVWVPGRGDSAGFARRSIDRALAAGLRFRPLERTVVDTLAWFREQPAERQAALRAGIDAATEARLLAAWTAGRG